MPRRKKRNEGPKKGRWADAELADAKPPGGSHAWLAGRIPVLRFVVGFAALMALYYILALTPFCDRLLYSYLQANAWASGVILNALGQHCQVSEVTIRSVHFAIVIRRGCDAVEPAWFFCAAIIAFPVAFKRKILGMLVGVSLLLALNLVRIVSLYFIGWRIPTLFSSVHLELWPVLFILSALVMWIGWIRWTRRASLEGHRHHVAT